MTSAGHCMIYARTPESKIVGCPSRAYVLMQLRFDGKIGFTGGIVEVDDETVEIGVGREMQEEMGIDPKMFPLSKDHLVLAQPFSCATLPQINTLYFYALEVKEQEIIEIEQNARKAVHFGEEVLGWIRVPLYTMADGYNGFPAFLENNFVGNAREQLLEGLIKTGVMTRDEVNVALEACISNNSKQ